MALVLIDTGPIIAYYNAGDNWHKPVRKFFENFRGQFVTTSPVITEVMWLLKDNHHVQNEVLIDISKGLYQIECLKEKDFARIADLNIKYADLPGDFADLSLIVISERLNIEKVMSLDADFNLYRRYRKDAFKQVFLPTEKLLSKITSKNKHRAINTGKSLGKEFW